MLVENLLTSNIFADSSSTSQATPKEKGTKIRATYHLEKHSKKYETIHLGKISHTRSGFH